MSDKGERIAVAGAVVKQAFDAAYGGNDALQLTAAHFALAKVDELNFYAALLEKALRLLCVVALFGAEDLDHNTLRGEVFREKP